MSLKPNLARFCFASCLALLFFTIPLQAQEVVVSIEIDYLPKWDHDAYPGDLFVYLDSDLLSWTSRGGQMAPTPTDRLERRLQPGKHILRIAHENHEKKSKKGWKHTTHISPLEIVFLLEEDEPATLKLHIQEAKSVFSTDKEPVALTVTQGSRTVYNVEKAGTKLRDWPLLCEDVRANVPEGKKPKKSILKDLDDCVSWQEIWKDAAQPMPRDAMRTLLERYDYEPRTYRRFE